MTDNVIRSYTLSVEDHKDAPGKVFILANGTDKTEYTAEDAPDSLRVFLAVLMFAKTLSEGGIVEDEAEEVPGSLAVH